MNAARVQANPQAEPPDRKVPSPLRWHSPTREYSRANRSYPASTTLPWKSRSDERQGQAFARRNISPTDECLRDVRAMPAGELSTRSIDRANPGGSDPGELRPRHRGSWL